MIPMEFDVPLVEIPRPTPGRPIPLEEVVELEALEGFLDEPSSKGEDRQEYSTSAAIRTACTIRRVIWQRS